MQLWQSAPAILYHAVRCCLQEAARVAVLGASGYTGAEVVRLTALHPGIKITALTGDRAAGKVRAASISKAKNLNVDA